MIHLKIYSIRTEHYIDAVMSPRDKGPVTRKMFPFDDVIMIYIYISIISTRDAYNLIWSVFDPI